MDATKPYEFVGFGATDAGTNPEATQNRPAQSGQFRVGSGLVPDWFEDGSGKGPVDSQVKTVERPGGLQLFVVPTVYEGFMSTEVTLCIFPKGLFKSNVELRGLIRAADQIPKQPDF